MIVRLPHRLALRRFGVLAATAGLVLTGVSAASSATGSAASDPTASTVCTSEPSEAHRVRPGAHAPDPNVASTAEVASASQRVASRQRELPNLLKQQILKPTSKISIKVYVHIIKKSSTAGDMGETTIAQQITVLNNAFASSGFTFVRQPTIRTVNPTWYNWSETADDAPAKKALYRGTVKDLNLYFADLGPELLGYATFPWDNAGNRDGVVLMRGTVPNGQVKDYNTGDTAVHEVGHWLGLLHTFQGGCGLFNDGVKDTPAQKDGDNIFDCKAANTCPAAGSDPYRNYMSYANDACLTNFTAGQGYRMRQFWYTYRSPQA